MQISKKISYLTFCFRYDTSADDEEKNKISYLHNAFVCMQAEAVEHQFLNIYLCVVMFHLVIHFV